MQMDQVKYVYIYIYIYIYTQATALLDYIKLRIGVKARMPEYK